MNTTTSSEFKHGWKILLIALLGVITSSNYVPLYSFGPLVQDFNANMNVSMGELQWAITFNFAGIAIGSQIAGLLIGRFGLRIVALTSLLSYAMLYVVMGFIELTQWSLYLFYFLIPMIGCGSLLISWTQIICQQFEKQRGLALAIVLSGGGVVSTSVPLILSGVVGTEYWQDAFFILAGFPVFAFIVCLFALRDSTGTTAKTPTNDATEESGKESSLELGITYIETLKTRQFWTMIVALILVVFVIVFMITNIVPMLIGKGMTRTEAAGVFSTFGVSLIFGRILGGILLDRIWAPLIAFIALSLPALGCLIFLYMPPNTALMMLATALVGVAAGAEYDILAYLVSRYFGLLSYSKTFGTLSGTIAFGSGLSPFIYGPILDATGNYDTLLLICVFCAFIGSLMFLTFGPYPDFEKQKKEQIAS